MFVIQGAGSAVATYLPHGWLNAVTVVAPADAWAVGWYDKPGTVRPRTFALHWDGVSWSRIWTPSGRHSTNSGLAGVSAVSSNDAWAVGSFNNGTFKTFTLHWDGADWTRVWSPGGPGATASDLSSVAAISANDVWAVGRYWGPDGIVKPLTLHWDGIRWSRAWTPDVVEGALSGVSGAGSDVWAVGWSGSSRLEPLAVRLDSSGWSRVQVPELSSGDDELSAVDALSATDVWIVGEGGFWHWNGSSWHTTPQPVQGGLRGVSVTSATDIWAAGDDWNGNIHAYHHDASGWHLTTLPKPDAYHVFWVTGVGASSATDVWVVGFEQGSEGYRMLLLHWDGTSWTRF